MFVVKHSKKILFLTALFLSAFFGLSQDAHADGLTIGTSTQMLAMPHFNLLYGVTSASNNQGSFLKFEKGPGNVVFQIDWAGNITTNGSVLGSNNYWGLSGSNLFTSSTSWNVGIGTTTVPDKLTISGGGLSLRTTGLSSKFILDTGWNASTGDFFSIKNSGAATPQILLTSSGNVGIGITNPGAKLTLSGSFHFNRPSAMVDAGNTIGISPGINNALIFAPTDITSNNGYFKFSFPDGNSVRFNSDYDGNLAGGKIRDIQFGSNAAVNMIIKQIDGTGNIGIGTTTIDARLKVMTLTGTGNAINVSGGILTGLSYPSTSTDAISLGYLESNYKNLAKYVTSTATVLNGARGGYDAANTLCKNTAINPVTTTRHICTTAEILNTINSGIHLPNSTQSWINNGPPGHTSNANDCVGWTKSTAAGADVYYGTIWNGNSTGGFGTLALCSDTYVFACCE
jgi:hypothetical protein